MEITDLIIKAAVTVTGLSVAVVIFYMLFFFIMIPERSLRELTYFIIVVFSYSLLMAAVITGSILYTAYNPPGVVSENPINLNGIKHTDH